MLNEYRILEKMATGSFGVVFKVRRVADNEVLVMKRISLTEMDVKQRREAAQEIRVMSCLHHPFIVAQRDAFLFKDSLCIVMDYYDGGDLAALITRQREKDEYLPMGQVMVWFAGINLAMHYLHAQGIVHRDLKTQNLFLKSNRREVAVGDFGVAEFVGKAEFSKTKSPFSSPLLPASQHFLAKRRDGELIGDVSTCDSADDIMNGPLIGAVRGTLLYMAPEVLESGVCSPSSDVWSLGCIFYELLSLRHPFESRDFATLMMRVMAGARQPPPGHYPPEVVQLLDRMLSLDAANRPSCEEILRAPIMKAYLQQIILQRASCEPTELEAERTWEAQMQRLCICENASSPRLPYPSEKCPTMSPSQERALVEQITAASPRTEMPLSPGTSTFGEDASPMRLHPDHAHTAQSLSKDGSFTVGRRKDDDGDGDGHLCPTWRSGDGNVDDMRHMPLELIEEEVARYRRLVQSEMREQKRQRDAEVHKRRFGGDCTPTAHYYNSLARVSHVATTASTNPHSHKKGKSNGPSLSSSPPPLPSHGWKNANSFNGAAAKWPPGSLEASLAARRRQRIEMAIGTLGDDVFSSVYNYYRSVEVAERDVSLVMQMVPNRNWWHVLPLVEEVVVIERLLERLEATGT
ncbi:putative serine/threonine protein kinase [Trypanosoma cruzi]|uniref:non-specific serine/threonine protein kinase n=2 Tax=Trypanosoma cruzi TaxID=5693 RepID=Q4D9Q1_TRYCC|nr:serine/threonine protein kinase, putative [Trypanosoma cruzi]EAN89254.1 serine/threonine protein kinase, putative [Trypanosoma cruzi]KAF5225918.1 hypothetical protein ECC02_000847 [Trypanosoma cruzi]KAF8294675.1 putative Serine/threonine-protein kinase NEK14 [Trypanosoma cruzi]PWV17950.1 putative serine/threonine protein kinase [Trypanosoma cruzi]RNC54938.1 putative protein kinase [Trypanosoma cruzi]|eukprot:XP_811105.1 serine/threonine protein kinase [Trypanosoma cruzi strain CL Brener]